MSDMIKKYVPYVVIVFCCLYAFAAYFHSCSNAEILTCCL